MHNISKGTGYMQIINNRNNEIQLWKEVTMSTMTNRYLVNAVCPDKYCDRFVVGWIGRNDLDAD